MLEGCTAELQLPKAAPVLMEPPGAANHLKERRRKRALDACWEPVPHGEPWVTGPVHLQKGTVCGMLRWEANRADKRNADRDGWRGREEAGGWLRAGGERKGWRLGRRVERVMRYGMMWEM